MVIWSHDSRLYLLWEPVTSPLEFSFQVTLFIRWWEILTYLHNMFVYTRCVILLLVEYMHCCYWRHEFLLRKKCALNAMVSKFLFSASHHKLSSLLFFSVSLSLLCETHGCWRHRLPNACQKVSEPRFAFCTSDPSRGSISVWCCEPVCSGSAGPLGEKAGPAKWNRCHQCHQGEKLPQCHGVSAAG